MATPLQSIDPALLALQTAKKAMPASPSTQQKKKPVLQSNIQQSQAPFATSSVTPTKIGGISSPFGATNINSSPVLGGATPQEIGTTAKQLQSLPKSIPETGTSNKIDVNVIGSLGANVMAGEDLPTIRNKYPEFSNIDDEVLGSVLATMYDGVGPEEILQKFPELQGGGQKSNKVMDFLSQVTQPFKTVGEGLAGLTTKAGEYLDPDTYNPAIQAVNTARMGAGLVDGSIQPRSEAENRYMDKSVSQNVLDTAEGTTYLASQIYAPITSAVFQLGAEIPGVRNVLGSVGEGFTRVGEKLKYVPGYRQYRESLPPEDQQRLDSFAGNMIATFAGTTGKKNLTQGKLKDYVIENFGSPGDIDRAFGRQIKSGAEATIAGVKKGAQGAGNFGLEVLGKTTGTSAETIKQVYKAAAKGETSAIEGLRGIIDDADVIESMKSSVQEIIDDRKTLYGKGYEELKKTKTPIDIRQIAGDTLRDLNNDLGVRFDAEGNLDFSQSKITSPAAQKNLQGIIDDLKNREDTSPLGLDILKQRVQDYARYTPEFAKSDRFATAVSNKIKNKITEIVPSYEDMMKNYGQASDLLKEIKQATAVGGNKANIATIGTKLKGLLRDNQEVRRMIVEKMQEVTGKNILGQVAGLQMQPRTPKGLQGVALGAGVGVLSQLADPTLLGGLLVASPRLVGEVANAVGVSVNFVQNFADKFKSFFKKNANGLDVSNGDMLRPSLPAGNAKVKTSKGQTPIPPTPKTPPITVEKGAIGMGTPKVNNTPVIPPKATVAPSVGVPKVDVTPKVNTKIEDSLLQETKKYKTSDDFIEYLRTSINDFTGGDRLTAEPKGLEKQRLDFIDYIQNKYPNKSGWFSSARQYFDDVVSKNNVAPKKGMPKLGKEIMEQDISQSDDLISEAKKYKSADEFYERTTRKVRDKFKEAGIRYRSDYEKFYNSIGIKENNILDTVNPTGGLYVDYTPSKRSNSILSSSKLATLSDTMKQSPKKEITIYRGAPKIQKGITEGDYITTNYDLAKSYGDNVLKKVVKLEDIIDSVDDSLGEEYLYIPKGKQKWSNKKTLPPLPKKGK